MQVQRATDCAIRILHYLHHYTPRGDVPTAHIIAQAVGISYPFFSKIANQLKRKGLVASVQGRNGGYRLAKSAREISVYDVILAMEEDLKINRCCHAAGKQCGRSAKGCTIRAYYREIREMLVDALSGKYITDFAIVWH